MGLFDFFAETGKKLFGNDNDAADNIKQHIEADNPGVENLGVEYESGMVSLSGTANSTEAMEKTVLMAGNVKGVTGVNADAIQVPPEEAKPQEQVEYYVIQSGDTLSALAKKYYGNAGDYPRIFEANREVIKDADKIYPGQKIRIPLDPA
jgi:nucleoid-associated protein YgaU